MFTLVALAPAPAAAQLSGPAAVDVLAEIKAKPNDGTDPTRPVRTLTLNYEHLNLRNDISSDIVAVALVGNCSRPWH